MACPSAPTLVDFGLLRDVHHPTTPGLVLLATIGLLHFLQTFGNVACSQLVTSGRQTVRQPPSDPPILPP